jgi:conjugal transfer pilus assembly protein TraF
VKPLALLFAALLVAPVLASAQDARPPFWSEAWRGWHFYEDPEAPEAMPPPPKRQPSSPSDARANKPKRPSELTEFDRLQATLEDARKVAIVKPSEENVRRYMELEAEVVARASAFADVAQRVAWSSPHLDPSLQGRPVNARALEVFEQQTLADRSRVVAELGRDHVLLFFFRSDCPYCHAFAPTILEFQARHGIKVEAVSLDGGPMPGFAGARRDNGIASALRVSQVPAVYLAQPFSGTITPIGFGVLSEAQLLERIVAVSEPRYRAMVPSTVRRLPTGDAHAPRSAAPSLPTEERP